MTEPTAVVTDGPRPDPAIELQFPPRLFNITRKQTRKAKLGSAVGVTRDWAAHIEEGPYTTTMLTLLPAHSGDNIIWVTWGYNAFADLKTEDAFWDNNATEKFRNDHTTIARAASEVFTRSQPWTWTALHTDLSHREEVTAQEYGSYKFFRIDDVVLKPGQFNTYAQYRRLLVEGLRGAGIEQPSWAYENVFGAGTQSFQIWTPFADVYDVDQINDTRVRLEEALGSERSAALAELAAASIQSSTTELQSVFAGGSFVSGGVRSGDPEFWASKSPSWP